MNITYIKYRFFVGGTLLVYTKGRPGATGGILRPCPPQMTACAPPKQKLCPPPKRGLCPEEINRLEATGVQIEAQIGGLHDVFGMKTFFFWRSPVYGRKNRLNFRFRPENVLEFLGRLFFFWRSPVFGRKNRLNFRFRPENPFESLLLTMFI